MATPTPIFGTGLVGMKSIDDLAALSQALTTLGHTGTRHIDTAPRYPPVNQGRAEQLLGEARAIDRGFTIHGKIVVHSDGAGGLDEAKTDDLLTTSLQRLGTEQVNGFPRVV
jgi:aflatoxin B1 aldehyde reductase